MAKDKKNVVTIAEQEYKVRFPVASLIKLKKEHGINLSDLQDEEKAQDIETIVALIWAGLVSDAPELTIDYLAENMEIHEMNEIAEVVGSVISVEGKKD